MRISVKKRGLSPVIASVLMILLVLVLAAMIFLWARTFVANQTENSELSAGKLCSYVSFNAMVNNEGNILEVINRGDVNISAFEIKIYADGDSEIIKIDVGVPAGESVKQEINLGDVNSFDKIEIFPVLGGATNGKSVVCHEEPVLLSNF